MNFLITGAQFSNKGAQSLLFTAVNEIKQKYPEASIFYLPIDHEKKNCFAYVNDFNFIFLYDNHFFLDIRGKKRLPGKVKKFIKSTVRKYKLKKKQPTVKMLSDQWRNINVLLDVSGYCLSSKFPVQGNNRLLRYINTAEKLGIPVVILPQSYGPFDYSEDPDKMKKRIATALDRADLVFVRERGSMDMLEKDCDFHKGILSTDIVLQSGYVDLKNIFSHEKKISCISLETKHNVGIIPNKQTVKHGNRETVLRFYNNIIGKLLELQKEVYIFPHSNDMELCREIYEFCCSNDHCHLIEKEMDCLEYSLFVRQFDYVIASRYHAIVHAYREGIPALIAGWAIKYQELAEKVHQEKYVFDITGDHDLSSILGSLENLNKNYHNESQIIRSQIADIRQNSCFEKCWEYLDSLK